MKYGLLGDIHANLSALHAVLGELEAYGVDQILSVGDVVGYGAAPRECIDLLREHGAGVVLGNHDAACGGLMGTEGFHAVARRAVDWTRDTLRDGDRRWLAELPLILETEHCEVAHGAVHDPEHFPYICIGADAVPSLDVQQRPVAFVGHSHVPMAALRFTDAPERTEETRANELDLEGVARALINVGSVGQPRDDDPRAAYGLFDTSTGRIAIRRVAYDVEREGARIRAAGLPEVLAQRLVVGM